MTTRNRLATIAVAAAITMGFASSANAMLLPAIQKVRDAAARAESRPAEEIAFNFDKITAAYVEEEEFLLGIYTGEIPAQEINGGLNRDIIRRITY